MSNWSYWVAQFLGLVLFATCGPFLAARLGLDSVGTMLLIGFALGLQLLSTAPSLALQRRITALETELGRSPA